MRLQTTTESKLGPDDTSIVNSAMMVVMVGGVMAGQQQLSTSDEHDSFVTFKIKIVRAKAKSKTQWESRVIKISNRISDTSASGRHPYNTALLHAQHTERHIARSKILHPTGSHTA